MKLSAQRADESCPAAVGGALSVERGVGNERMCGRAGSEGSLRHAGVAGGWAHHRTSLRTKVAMPENHQRCAAACGRAHESQTAV